MRAPGAPRSRVRATGPTARLRRALLSAAAALVALTLGPRVLAPAAAAPAAAPNEAGIVDIDTRLAYEGTEAAGTGLVLTSAGEVLTNNHVIRGETWIRVVEPASGKSYRARVVGYDPAADVAVLQLQGASGLRTVTPGDSAAAAVGEAVTAVGNAGGVGGTPSVSRGKVIALRQTIMVSEDTGGGQQQLSQLIETNAQLEPGDSGGPLLDRAGAVIAMDTAAAANFGFRQQPSQSYSIPIDRALSLARRIEAGEASTDVHVGPTSFLGVYVNDPSQRRGVGSDTTAGAYILEVIHGSPAARAGLSPGDVITSLDGRAIASASSVTGVILGLAPGATVALRWRAPSGDGHSSQITLRSGPPQ